jgi:hypothetical protein
LISFGQRLEAALRGLAKLLSSKTPRRFLEELRPRFDFIARQYPELRQHLDREWRFFESSVAERENDWPRVERLERRLLQSWPQSDSFGRSVRWMLLVDAQLHQRKLRLASATALRALSEPGDPISHGIIFARVTDGLEDAADFVLKAARALGERVPRSSSPGAVRRMVEKRLARLRRLQANGANLIARSAWRPPKT